MRNELLVAALGLLTAQACSAQPEKVPEKGSCGYYLYVDSVRGCGKKGYLFNYGYRYCNFYLAKHAKRFSDEGKNWAADMGYCLEQKIHNMSDSIPCKALGKLARKSHLPCMLEAGYLDLSKKDRHAYMRLGARNPVNWPSGIYFLWKLRKLQHLKDDDQAVRSNGLTTDNQPFYFFPDSLNSR